jgi:hypothetical protein
MNVARVVMTVELAADHIRATTDPDTLRVLKHLIDERCSMLEAAYEGHLRPMVQTHDGSTTAARQAATSRGKEVETGIPAKRKPMR